MSAPIASERIRLHLDAQDDTTISADGADRITEWRDKGPAGRHFAAHVSAGRPLRVAGAVRFDPPGTTTATNLSSQRILQGAGDILNGYPRQVFAVLSRVNNPPSGNEYGPIVTTLGSAQTRYDSVNHRSTIYRDGSFIAMGFSPNWAEERWHLIHVDLATTTRAAQVDEGWSVFSDSIGARVAHNTTSFLGSERLASWSFPANRLSGDLHELLVLEGALTVNERTDLLDYFHGRWPNLPFAPAAGRTIDIHGARVARVVLFDWDSPAAHVAPPPDSDGQWHTFVPYSVRFGVYYQGAGMQPRIEGPYLSDEAPS